MNLTTRTNQNSRRGITLLLTISMIVLFLLMGTAFVIVANDYFKTSRRRSAVNSFRVDSTALLDRAFYDLFRGVDLRDANSSLRTHSILEDQYGYGLTSPLDSVANGPIPALTVLSIDRPTLTYIRGDGTTSYPASDYRNGIFNGRVITVISADGQNYYSTRIISHFLETDAGGNLRLLITIPTDPSGLLVAGVANGERVLINGRDFSGFGAGDVVGLAGDNVLASGMMPSDVLPMLESDFEFSGGSAPASLLGANSLQPNRIGEALLDLTVDGGYLENDNGPNEPYDIPDAQNMFLSGGIVGTPNYRPSFYDENLAQNSPRTSFRPIVGSTASNDFPSINAIGTISGVDADADNDQILDAVWIDIGLPVQVDDQGRKFRPMVAYRVVDMDGRLDLNAHGSYADLQQIIAAGGPTPRRGSSYGPAEISLGDVLGNAGGFTNYSDLLNTRSGVTESPPRPGNQSNGLGIRQNLFGYPDSDFNTGGLFSTGSDVFGRGVIERGSAFGTESLPEFVSGPALSNAATISAYAADFSIGGGVGDNHFQALELEPLLRRFDVDSSLIDSSRLGELGLNAHVNSITTGSFEIAVPPVSVMELLRNAVAADNGNYDAIVNAGYLSNEILMGGRFDLNQLTGNGVDDDGDNIVDEADEANTSSQRQDGLPFNLAGARQRKATQLYTLAMLVTGSTPPSYITGAGTMSPQEYRRAVAQWAINVVDFSDADSICTIFEYDTNPFNDMLVDGDPTTEMNEPDRDVVFGVERPEIIFNEVLATHDRRNQDLTSDAGEGADTMDADGDMMPDDDDWDSGFLPETTAYIELTNPNTQTDTVNDNVNTAFQRNAAEFDQQQRGVNLSLRAPDDAPVWRIGVRRQDDVSQPFVRGIFFTDPTAGPADARFANDNFFPSAAPTPNGGLVRPGEYFVLGSLGNVPSEQMSTFGRPTSNIEDIANTRSIRLDETIPGVVVRDWNGMDFANQTFNCGIAVIDSPRSLSLSDPDGGYEPIVSNNPALTLDTSERDGTIIMPARDRPLDADADPADINAIWTNGVTDGFRFLYLQRLADPTRPFDAMLNPYLTVDKAKVNLLAFNGLESDPDSTLEHYDMDSADGVQGMVSVIDGNTDFRTIERGESFTVPQARRNRLRVEAGNPVTTDAMGLGGVDSMNFSFELEHTFGSRNESHNGTESLGWLVWNNRPFANAMELIHVPFTSNENLLERVNFSRTNEEVFALDAMSEPEDVFAYYLSDDKFGHLIGYGGMSPTPGGSGGVAAGLSPFSREATFANRFDYIFDFVDVPTRFLGSKTFLPANVMANPAAGLTFNMQAPFNTVLNFREPGKMNINMIPNATVYDALSGGFGSLNFNDFRADRDIAGASSGFEGRFTTATGGQFVSPGVTAQANGAAGLFRRDAMDPTSRIFDFESIAPTSTTNSNSSSWFENEFRQRLASATTIRSSVFAIWVTIGYFEVDAMGRVGAELGSEGQVRRDRAFYMVDRSIPVACEPGKNHNVDEAVLVRSIIE